MTFRDYHRIIDQAVLDYTEGASLNQIAEMYGVSYGTARNWMIRRNVKLRSRGTSLNDRGSIEERIRKRIEIDPITGCWNWIGAISNNKYGSIYYEGRMQKAHIVSRIIFNGE